LPENEIAMLKKMILCTAAALTFYIADAQQLKTPPPSPKQTLKQEFGVGEVELTYSRPSSKGRKIYGDLVPFGALWRTGANAATKIKFSDDVTVGGQPVKAGEYVIYTIPAQNEWEVILNKGLSNWGIDGYKQEEDVARFKVRPINTPESMETFTMQFANVKNNSADLRIWWDKTAVVVPITTDVDTKVMAQINNVMNRDNRPYFAAATYYMETGKDINQAVAWFDKAIEQNPEAFWVHHQRANALAKAGKKADARAAAQLSMELARKANNNDYVKLNEKLLADLK
jgi:tetratricopeptide (TPR) repeat protein